MSDNLVICPNCVHQFRAISVSDQERIAKLQAELELAETVMREHDCHDVWSDAIKEVVK